MTEQLINSIEFDAPQDRDRIILIGYGKDVAERLHLLFEGNELLEFYWDKNKLFSRDALFSRGQRNLRIKRMFRPKPRRAL